MARALTDADLKEMRDRFARCVDAEQAQRKSILECKNFRALNQWPESVKIQREGGGAITGQAAQPPRPCLVIDRVGQPIQQVSNAIQNANFAADFSPNGHGADDVTARMLQGLWRRVQNQAADEDPIGWAGDQMAEGGLGWFRMRSAYCDDGDDQEIVLERITNNLSVYCDPGAVSPTRADATFMFVTEDIDRQEAKRKYRLKESDLQGLDEFSASGDTQKFWVTKDTIRVVEYWCLDSEDDPLYRHKETGVLTRQSELGEQEPDEAVYERRRTLSKPVVKFQRCIATKELDAGTWAGTRIPLFPVMGKELNVDGRTVLMGVTQPAIGPQQMVNWSYSASIEVAALAPKSPFLAAASATMNYKGIWDTANIYNYSTLPWDPFDSQGRPNPKPERQEPNVQIGAFAQLLAISEDAVKATTSFDPGLGDASTRKLSGEAVQSLQQQQAQASSHWLTGVKRAVLAAAKEFLAAAPVYYDRPGRVVHLAGIDDKSEAVMIGQHFVPGQNGQPPQPVDAQSPEVQQGIAQFYDLKKSGQYAVAVTVSKATPTRRQEGVAAMSDLAHAAPELVPRYADIWVGAMDFPEAQDISKRLQPPDVMMKGVPPQVAQQMQQLAGENQQLKQALQSKMAEAQAKGQIDLQGKQIDAETRVKVAGIQAEATVTAAEIKAGMESLGLQLKKMELLIGLQNSETDAAQEARMAHEAHLHAASQAGRDHAHETVHKVIDQAHQSAMAAQAHQHALDQGQQAADLAPDPVDKGSAGA